MAIKCRFGSEVKAGAEYARLKRFSVISSLFDDFDALHPNWLISANRSWKRYRKTQYRAE